MGSNKINLENLLDAVTGSILNLNIGTTTLQLDNFSDYTLTQYDDKITQKVDEVSIGVDGGIGYNSISYEDNTNITDMVFDLTRVPTGLRAEVTRTQSDGTDIIDVLTRFQQYELDYNSSAKNITVNVGSATDGINFNIDTRHNTIINYASMFDGSNVIEDRLQITISNTDVLIYKFLNSLSGVDQFNSADTIISSTGNDIFDLGQYSLSGVMAGKPGITIELTNDLSNKTVNLKNLANGSDGVRITFGESGNYLDIRDKANNYHYNFYASSTSSASFINIKDIIGTVNDDIIEFYDFNVKDDLVISGFGGNDKLDFSNITFTGSDELIVNFSSGDITVSGSENKTFHFSTSNITNVLGTSGPGKNIFKGLSSFITYTLEGDLSATNIVDYSSATSAMQFTLGQLGNVTVDKGLVTDNLTNINGYTGSRYGDTFELPLNAILAGSTYLFDGGEGADNLSISGYVGTEALNIALDLSDTAVAWSFERATNSTPVNVNISSIENLNLLGTKGASSNVVYSITFKNSTLKNSQNLEITSDRSHRNVFRFTGDRQTGSVNNINITLDGSDMQVGGASNSVVSAYTRDNGIDALLTLTLQGFTTYDLRAGDNSNHRAEMVIRNFDANTVADYYKVSFGTKYNENNYLNLFEASNISKLQFDYSSGEWSFYNTANPSIKKSLTFDYATNLFYSDKNHNTTIVDVDITGIDDGSGNLKTHEYNVTFASGVQLMFNASLGDVSNSYFELDSSGFRLTNSNQNFTYFNATFIGNALSNSWIVFDWGTVTGVTVDININDVNSLSLPELMILSSNINNIEHLDLTNYYGVHGIAGKDFVVKIVSSADKDTKWGSFAPTGNVLESIYTLGGVESQVFGGSQFTYTANSDRVDFSAFNTLGRLLTLDGGDGEDVLAINPYSDTYNGFVGDNAHWLMTIDKNGNSGFFGLSDTNNRDITSFAVIAAYIPTTPPSDTQSTWPSYISNNTFGLNIANFETIDLSGFDGKMGGKAVIIEINKFNLLKNVIFASANVNSNAYNSSIISTQSAYQALNLNAAATFATNNYSGNTLSFDALRPASASDGVQSVNVVASYNFASNGNLNTGFTLTGNYQTLGGTTNNIVANNVNNVIMGGVNHLNEASRITFTLLNDAQLLALGAYNAGGNIIALTASEATVAAYSSLGTDASQTYGFGHVDTIYMGSANVNGVDIATNGNSVVINKDPNRIVDLSSWELPRMGSYNITNGSLVVDTNLVNGARLNSLKIDAKFAPVTSSLWQLSLTTPNQIHNANALINGYTMPLLNIDMAGTGRLLLPSVGTILVDPFVTHSTASGGRIGFKSDIIFEIGRNSNVNSNLILMMNGRPVETNNDLLPTDTISSTIDHEVLYQGTSFGLV